jgi:hypothetical protein
MIIENEIQLNKDELDDGSVVVSFDMWDRPNNEIVQQSGYVHIKSDEDDGYFYITVYNSNGDVVSETPLPFNFLSFE